MVVTVMLMRGSTQDAHRKEGVQSQGNDQRSKQSRKEVQG